MASKKKSKSKSKPRKRRGRSIRRRPTRRKKIKYVIIYHDGAVFHVRAIDHQGRVVQHKSAKDAGKAKDIALFMARKHKVPLVVKRSARQKGASDLARDKKYRALPPGKRISRSGKVYYEYRRNRSDLRGHV